MPASALLSAVLAAGFEQFVQWRYGPTGIVGLLLLTVGIKTKSHLCSSLGAFILAVLFTQPAL
ncbi:hypothetical protein [Streptomyces sp. NPDC093261]|uniref:hypothetical protein n=1 Tax=Streptomyces sp. NPDC093261 TaxID=3366037 RepID=UPI0038263F67